jgi:hypothetical protein
MQIIIKASPQEWQVWKDLVRNIEAVNRLDVNYIIVTQDEYADLIDCWESCFERESHLAYNSRFDILQFKGIKIKKESEI